MKLYVMTTDMEHWTLQLVAHNGCLQHILSWVYSWHIEYNVCFFCNQLTTVPITNQVNSKAWIIVEIGYTFRDFW